VDGRSLSEPDTYRKIAEAAGLDADAVVAAFQAPAAQAAAEADFRRTAELGVDAFPALLAVDGDRAVVLTSGNATTGEVDRRLSAVDARDAS
jgi:putative protein-disulfide isomerase